MIQRCRTGADFTALRRGRRTGGRVLWMLYASDDELTHPRVAFAIGRRAGTAVQRNRLRRRIQALLRELDDSMAPGRYLFGARRPAANMSYAEISADVRHLIDRARAPS